MFGKTTMGNNIGSNGHRRGAQYDANDTYPERELPRAEPPGALSVRVNSLRRARNSNGRVHNMDMPDRRQYGGGVGAEVPMDNDSSGGRQPSDDTSQEFIPPSDYKGSHEGNSGTVTHGIVPHRTYAFSAVDEEQTRMPVQYRHRQKSPRCEREVPRWKCNYQAPIECTRSSTICAGINLSNGIPIIVKTIRPHLGELTAEELLEKMDQFYSLLDHQHIATYHGCEWDHNTSTLFILMEFVTGGSLSDLVQRFKPLDVRIARKYTKEIISALQHLHSHGIVHGDVKTGNVLIDDDGSVKLADFDGSFELIHLKDSPRTNFGSPIYVAPEVAKHVDRLSQDADVWGIGCIVLEMATGTPPWCDEYDDRAEVIHRLKQGTDSPSISSTVDPTTESFIRQCLDPNPRERPSLEQLQNHEFLKQRPRLN